MLGEKLRGFSIDTAVVAFLLAVELGRSSVLLSFDSGLIGTALIVVAILPFCLTVEAESFSRWLAARGAVIVIGMLAGASLAESVSLAPMTLLIAAVFVSCSIQLYSLFKLRLVE